MIDLHQYIDTSCIKIWGSSQAFNLQIFLSIFNKGLWIFDRVTMLDGMLDWFFLSCYQLNEKFSGKILPIFTGKFLDCVWADLIGSVTLNCCQIYSMYLKFNLHKCCMDALASHLMDQKMVQNCLPFLHNTLMHHWCCR